MEYRKRRLSLNPPSALYPQFPLYLRATPRRPMHFRTAFNESQQFLLTTESGRQRCTHLRSPNQKSNSVILHNLSTHTLLPLAGNITSIKYILPLFLPQFLRWDSFVVLEDWKK